MFLVASDTARETFLYRRFCRTVVGTSNYVKQRGCGNFSRYFFDRRERKGFALGVGQVDAR